jgi:hypothetical protein
MATFTNSGLKDVRDSGTGIVLPYFAGGRIPFGAFVQRAGATTVKAAVLEDSVLPFGVALEDPLGEHTYDGFYESGEPIPIAITGTVNALISTVGNASLICGDYMEIIDITSGTMASGVGVIDEAGNSAGQTRSTYSVARMMEDLTLTNAISKAVGVVPTAGDGTITMTSGDPTLMGLQNGDYIIIRDDDGTTAQINRVTTVADTLLTLQIPVTVAAASHVMAIRQGRVLILHGA